MEINEITKAFFRATSESLGTTNFYETKEGIIIPLKMVIDIYKIDSCNEYHIKYVTINNSGSFEIEFYTVDEDEYNVIKYLMNIINYSEGCTMKKDYAKTRNIIKGII